MSDLIDRERFSADMRDFQNRVGIWRDEAEDTETRTRADAALATIIETKLILDKQPTITASPWHRVEDGLPKPHRDVLVSGMEAINNSRVYKVMVNDNGTWRPMNYAPSIRWDYWMPIEPPKEEN